MDEIEQLRAEIRGLDQELVRLTARRLTLARRVGAIKRAAGQPIRNYVVEAEAIQLVHATARSLGVRPEIAEELLKLEIQESLRVQERDRVGHTRAHGTGGAALVIGAAGNMGRWFVEFLESKGFNVSTSDPRGPVNGREHVADAAAEAGRFTLILLATPPSATAAVIRSLQGRTTGLLLDIASLKAPVAQALHDYAAAGGHVASIHPMWGPTTDLLASKNLVLCDVGDPDGVREARKLFDDTAANLVEMPLDAHDRFMGLVLGLPHAVSLLFGAALAGTSVPYGEVAHLGGPTFQKQVAVAREVASENKDLYYEIQQLNPHTPEVLKGLRTSLDELEAVVADRSAFKAYMARPERYFRGDP